jgi:hypothetical protein
VFFDHSAQALAGGGEVVFDFGGAALGMVGFAGACVAFGK